MDTPFYKRALDSFADDIITRVRQSENGTWYAALDVGVNSWVSDPDFAMGAETREGAVALVAKTIRNDARGIGKFAPHGVLTDGYDLKFRLMKWWVKKEVVRDAGMDPLAFRDACIDAGKSNVWQAPGGWLESTRNSGEVEAEFRVGLILLDAAVAAGTPPREAIAKLVDDMAGAFESNRVYGEKPHRILYARIAEHVSERGYNESPEAAARYVVSDPDRAVGWGHIFTETDPETGETEEHERLCRFVYDTEEGRLLHLEIERLGGWAVADEAETADVEDSLKNANPETLADPGNWGLGASDDLPDWCPAPAVGPRP